ncbi:MAG: hypothetical protein UU77_C0007G0026 [candidate division WWE3 bacterium GW2011_GWC1_41_7]|uniref:Uncharacterized protein n=3 Tax=Katanobacteria TaxID=422282 RepID=A0A0G0XA30_UNCKA|nr:MAG: hypothetical protein UU77_C0007G0026 [candidate division WWE3 bacterium GW2011_GWC1_41_7]KKS21839.1 MAG: hypothetical protein UU80_C0019G0019 [candidate division WWE3 bacterium GW2011_GWA1_41_8]
MRPILVVLIVFILGASAAISLRSNLFKNSSEDLYPNNDCKKVTNTLQYKGCSTTYDDYIVNDNCSPCNGITPCMYGIYPVHEYKIVDCLCKKDSNDDANDFANKRTIWISRKMSENDVGDVCNNIPDWYYNNEVLDFY